MANSEAETGKSIIPRRSQKLKQRQRVRPPHFNVIAPVAFAYRDLNQ
jgi:hypothetical protein